MNAPFKIQVLIRILLIVFITIDGCLFYFIYQWWMLSILCGIIILILISDLVRFLNKTNERINYFFEAAINDDFTLLHPKKMDKFLQQLNTNLTKLNTKIQQTKIDSLKQEHYLRTVIEHVGTGILTYNNKGFVIHANSSVKKLFNLEQLTHINQLNKVDKKLLSLFNKINQKEQQLITINIGHNQINLLIKANKLVSQDEELKLLSIQNIDQELDEKELDSWLKLIRVLTHEIMNSIAPITSLSDSLSQFFIKEGEPVESKEISNKVISTTIRGLEIIREQGKGLISFVESYRKLTRLPKPEKTIIDVPEFLERIIILCKAGIPDSKVGIKVSCPNKDLKLLADEKLITQIIINLIKNATEAIGYIDDGLVEISAKVNKNEKLEISIKDNGPGIPPDLLDEIFVPFFTTKDKGSGIGLSLSRQIMRLHGGTIKAQSIPDKVTLFNLEFPL